MKSVATAEQVDKTQAPGLQHAAAKSQEQQQTNARVPSDTIQSTINPATLNADGLPPGSYTALQLQHATPEHLHITSRRCFIGPIPEAWLSRHRKSWYRYRPSFARYSSRTASFLAGAEVSHIKSLTGLEGMTGKYRPSFPQPRELVEEAERVVQLEDPVASTTSGDIPNETATAPPDLQRANSTAVLDPDEEEPLQRKKSQDKKSVGRPSSSSSTKGKANHQKAESGSSSWWRRPSRPVFTRKSSGKSVGSSSFVTAAESLGDEQIDDATDADAREFNMPGFSQIVTNEGDGSRRESTLLGSPSMSNNAASINSRVGLLDKPGGAGGDGDRRLTLDLGAATSPRPQSSSALKTPTSVLKRPGTSRTKRPESPASQQGEEQPPVNRLKPLAPVATNLVRFTEPSKNAQADQDFDDHGDKQKRSNECS